MSSRWRNESIRVITEVLAGRDPQKASPEELKKIKQDISAAYPFGPRAHHPYKIWCDQVAITLGTKKKKTIPDDGSATLFS